MAQTILYPSDDPQLVLVAGKDVLVKVNAITTLPAEAKPAGTLMVQDASGQVLQTIVLTKPTATLSSTVPETPNKANFYSAVVPGSRVVSGLRLVASLENGQSATTINPRVGAANPITLMAIPVQIQGVTGTVLADAGNYLKQRGPLGQVTMVTHPVFTSTRVTSTPTEAEWGTAMNAVLDELGDLYITEGASNRTYYYGFLPKSTYGLAGVGQEPGNAAVGLDMPANPDAAASTMVHEIGHNFGLKHAPCGGPDDADPAYPYPNANLGGTARYRWIYLADQGTFVNPHDTNLHDVMSYCNGNMFSDYNYRVLQKNLTPTDARVIGAQVVATAAQEVVLISGRIGAGGNQLRPLKSFQGKPTAAQSGAYILRIVTDSSTVDTPFATKRYDHEVGVEHFSFAIANPGNVVRISIIANGQVILDKAATTSSSGAVATRLAASRIAVNATETGGKLKLSWDAVKYPYLSVTHVGAQRAGLSMDLTGGSASLPLTGVPAGGNFEFILSDGMNSVRLQQAR